MGTGTDVLIGLAPQISYGNVMLGSTPGKQHHFKARLGERKGIARSYQEQGSTEEPRVLHVCRHRCSSPELVSGPQFFVQTASKPQLLLSDIQGHYITQSTTIVIISWCEEMTVPFFHWFFHCFIIKINISFVTVQLIVIIKRGFIQGTFIQFIIKALILQKGGSE